MSTNDPTYRTFLILAVMAAPLLVYSQLGGPRSIVLEHSVDLTRSNAITTSVEVRRRGGYSLNLLIDSGGGTSCLSGVAHHTCELDVEWRVVSNGSVVLTGRSDTTRLGTWPSGDRLGVTLGSLNGSPGERYEITLDVRSAAPRLMNRHPLLVVEAGPDVWKAGAVKHAIVGLIGAVLLLFGLASAGDTVLNRRRRKRTGAAPAVGLLR